MADFYGLVIGNRGEATRSGSRNSGFKSTCQSYDGSVITRMWYDNENQLKISLEVDNGSKPYGDEVFRGTYAELVEMAGIWKELKSGKASITRHRTKSNRELKLERAFRKLN